MSDSRSISGTVKVASSDSLYSAAVALAGNLWYEKHKKVPSMDDQEYFNLLYRCVRILNGVYTK
jgi:hypothetical protein